MTASATSPLRDHPDPLQTRRIATEWLRHLPPLDVVSRQEHVIRAFEGMRHACAAADLDRAAAIEHLDTALEIDHRRLVKWYLENLDGSPALAERFWHVAHDVNRGFVYAYHALLEGAQASGRDRRWQQRLPLLFARLVHFHGIDARLVALRGGRWPPAHWAQLHRLFLQAADAGVERVPTTWEGADPLAPRWTVEQEYLHVLLAQQVDGGNLAPAELDWVTREIRGWARELALEAAPVAPGGFYVDLSGTSGLIRRVGADRGAKVGYLDTTPLIRRLDAAIAALRETDGVESARFAHRQRLATLAKIRPALAPARDPDPRRHPRVAVDAAATLRVGLPTIAQGFAPSPDAEEGAATTPLVATVGRGAGSAAMPRVSEPAAAAWHSEVALLVEEIEIRGLGDDPMPGAALVEPLQASAAAPVHEVLADPGWRVKDRSLGGMRLVGRRAPGAALPVGTLVAVHPAGDEDWVLGVVSRRRNDDGEAIELGVALLTERALPVTLVARRPPHADVAFGDDAPLASAPDGRFGGLYLIPPAQPDERPPSRTIIIPTAEHFEGRKLLLATPRSRYAVTLRHLVDRHADWSRVAIQVSARL